LEGSRSVTVRIMGETPEDVKAVATAIENSFKGWCITSPIFRNTRDPGFRCYVNVRVERKDGGIERGERQKTQEV